MTDRPLVTLAMRRDVARQVLSSEHHARIRAVAHLSNPTDPLDNLTTPEAQELLARTDILLTGWGCPPLTQGVLADAPRLGLVVHAAGSVKPVITDAVWSRGMVVTSAADANAVAVAEFTIAAITFAAKDVFRARDAYRRSRGVGWRDPDVLGLHDRRVGVVAASHTGRAVISRAVGLGLPVAVYDPYLRESDARALDAQPMGLAELLAWSDIVTLHAPALPETAQLIGSRELASMRTGSWLINTARGALVDHTALLEACRDGRLNVIIDTTEPEPLPPDSELWDLPNVVVTPHLAGSLGSELLRLGDAAVDEIERFLSGRAPRQPVHERDLGRLA